MESRMNGFVPQTRETYLKWATVTVTEGRNLTQWETNFIWSIKNQLEEKRPLSRVQAEKLEWIYAEKTP
jgi:hypothetical protein